MKFHTHQLNRGPVDFAFRCPPEEISLNDSDIQFVGEVSGTIHFTQVENGRVLAQGQADSMLRFDCVRCLESAMMTLHGELIAIYEEKSGHHGETDPFDDPADHAVIPFNGDTLDPTPQIRETVMLSVPDFPVCRPDCKGLCLQCGSNLNLGPCRCNGTAKALPDWKAKLLNLNPGAGENPKGQG